MDSTHTYALLGTIEDSTLGLAPFEVMIASAQNKAALELVLEQFENASTEEEEYDGIWFESPNGHIWFLTEPRITWLQ